MKLGSSVALLVLLAASAAAAKGLTIYDLVRGTTAAAPPTPKPCKEAGPGLDLADALNPGPKPPKPAGGSDGRFSLEDALSPDPRPADGAGARDLQALGQQLSEVLQNQKKQLGLLERVMARLNLRPM